MTMLFGCYARLGTLNLARNSIRAIDAAILPELKEYPQMDQMRYRYYYAGYMFWCEDYTGARSQLDTVWELLGRVRTHDIAKLAKARDAVLNLLVPLNFLNGRLLISTDSVYQPISDAINHGNVYEMHKLLYENADSSRGIGSQTFLVLERAMLICWRNLVKRVVHAMHGNTRVPFQAVVTAASLTGM